MKLIPLTRGHFAKVDDADFEWLNQWKWYAHVASNTVYAVRNIKVEKGKWTLLWMHRQILGLTDPEILGEHADGNGLNNTRKNIRPATHSQNQMNRTSKRNSSSGHKGVSWNKPLRKWVSLICIGGKSKHIGCFEKEEDAARAYNQFAKEHHGEYARFNDVTPLFPDKEFMPQVLRNSNTSGFRGVCFEKRSGKWVSKIKNAKKEVHIGSFRNPLDAAKAYDKKAVEIHGDSAILNFPNPV